MVFAKGGGVKFATKKMRDNIKYNRTEHRKVDKRLLCSLWEEEQNGQREAKGGSVESPAPEPGLRSVSPPLLSWF